MPEETPSEQPEPTRTGAGASFSWGVWLFLVLFVIYPLSIGPAAKLHQLYPAARPIIEAVYLPIVKAVESSPPVRDFFMWYIWTLWHR